MICPRCGTNYIRLPCPNCNWDDRKKKDDTPERTMKPSQLRGESAVNRKLDEGQDTLRKSSELLTKKTVEPKTHLEKSPPTSQTSFNSFNSPKPTDNGEQLVKPSVKFAKPSSSNENDRLLKPSERIAAQNARIVNTPLVEDNDSLLKPSMLSGTSGRLPKSPMDKKKEAISDVKSGLEEFNKKIDADETFKSNVKNTLIEVITLLENLIED